MIQLNPVNRQTTKVNVQLRTEPPQDEIKVKVLINSIYCWIECSFIVFEKDGVRLNFYILPYDICFCKLYKSEKGARVAMANFCRKRIRELYKNREKDEVLHYPKLDWSPKLRPETIWIEDREKRKPFYYQGMHS